MQLYRELIAKGIKVSNHASDLYCPLTVETMDILSKYPVHFHNATTFVADDNGQDMIEVPFAYEPFWQEQAKKNPQSFDGWDGSE